MELVKGKFFEVSGINCSIENPSFVTAVISEAPWPKLLFFSKKFDFGRKEPQLEM
jgi:hypothetical protein